MAISGAVMTAGGGRGVAAGGRTVAGGDGFRALHPAVVPHLCEFIDRAGKPSAVYTAFFTAGLSEYHNATTVTAQTLAALEMDPEKCSLYFSQHLPEDPDSSPEDPEPPVP